jgi:hypothetical protein
MLACGLLAVAVSGAHGRALVALTAAGVIGALQIPVLEFDSDVPQFAVWTYLPVAVAGWLVAAGVIESVPEGRRLLVRAAVAYTTFRAAIALGLVSLDHSTSVVPPVLLLLGVRHLAKRFVPQCGLAVEAGGGVLVWGAWLAVAGEAGTAVGGRDLVIASALATASGLLVLGWRTASGRTAVAMGGTTLLLVVLVGPLAGRAAAHDPGQGDELAAATLEVTRTDGIATVRLLVDGGCAALVPERVVGRRAGSVMTGALRATGSCRFEGQLPLDRAGRWFVYVELEDSSGPIELWAPLDDTEGQTVVDRSLYRPPQSSPSGAVLAAGGLLYGASLAGVAWAARRVRAVADLQPGHTG